MNGSRLWTYTLLSAPKPYHRATLHHKGGESPEHTLTYSILFLLEDSKNWEGPHPFSKAHFVGLLRSGSHCQVSKGTHRLSVLVTCLTYIRRKGQLASPHSILVHSPWACWGDRSPVSRILSLSGFL